MKGGWLSELATLKYTPWFRWHPQLALRYLPVVEKIREEGTRMKEKGQMQTRILEVGSGGLGIAPYLKQPVTGVDVRFDPPFHLLLKRIVGKAEKLQFPTNSFDIVLSMDMLEHLPKSHRQQAISEMVRVAKDAVVIGVPCGEVAGEFDQWLHQRYQTVNRREYQFLHEQVEYGVPSITKIKQAIKIAADNHDKSVEIQVEGNGNIDLRRFLMTGWLSQNLIVNFIFRKVFLLLIPVFSWLDRPPYYRQIFFVTIEKSKNKEQ